MTPTAQMLRERFPSLRSKAAQQALFACLLRTYAAARQVGSCVLVGEPEQAVFVVSANNISGMMVLCELVETLATPVREKLTFVFGAKPLSFPGKLHIRIGNISKGNELVIAANAAARDLCGASIKKVFQPDQTHSLQFQKAEGLFRRFPPECPEVILSSRMQKPFLRRRPSMPKLPGNYVDKQSIKLVCDAILRLTKTSLA